MTITMILTTIKRVIMGIYQELKNAIANVIKENHNEEITGEVLQNALQTIIATIGQYYTIAGVATPTTNPGVPDQRTAYIAGTQGTYANFNAITLSKGEIALLATTATGWQKLTIATFLTDEDIEALRTELEVEISGKANKNGDTSVDFSARNIKAGNSVYIGGEDVQLNTNNEDGELWAMSQSGGMAQFHASEICLHPNGSTAETDIIKVSKKLASLKEDIDTERGDRDSEETLIKADIATNTEKIGWLSAFMGSAHVAICSAENTIYETLEEFRERELDYDKYDTLFTEGGTDGRIAYQLTIGAGETPAPDSTILFFYDEELDECRKITTPIIYPITQ